ncbi:MAG: hypothetical protein GXY55_11330 [Phycisphaerae bacterium]|nr:hypothetical protein [Phycisphaerae bacterium]
MSETAPASNAEAREDYPLSEVPAESRKGLCSNSVVLLGFTFFTATMWGGGKLGVAFPFGQLVGLIALGNLLLGLYVAVLGYVVFKTGLNSVLLARFSPGVPPLNGILGAIALYIGLDLLLPARPVRG